IHYANHQPESLPAQIEVCSLSTFSQGNPIRVAPHPHRCITPEESVNRAMSRLGEQEYSVLFNNCEHFVHWVLHGKARSQQVNNALIGLTTVVLTGVGRWALKKYRGSER
ncbi:lecithin retinol acyltransferase family protein, partial [Vibrio cholerae]|nr:lecithin retinol acyltransferase family protein [Vibrio cholerae]